MMNHGMKSPFRRDEEIELKLDESSTERFKRESGMDNVLSTVNRLNDRERRRQ